MKSFVVFDMLYKIYLGICEKEFLFLWLYYIYGKNQDLFVILMNFFFFDIINVREVN